MKLKSLIVALAAFCVASAAFAHHSFALFDRSRITTLNGTVKEWKWANPHSWLMVVVRKADGTDEEWALVGSSPNMMSRWGWNAADISVGDKVLADPAGASGEALAGGPVHLPTKPEGVPYP